MDRFVFCFIRYLAIPCEDNGYLANLSSATPMKAKRNVTNAKQLRWISRAEVERKPITGVNQGDLLAFIHKHTAISAALFSLIHRSVSPPKSGI